jgi:glycosyltransferase involved in cell wall biosynthesis
MTTLSVVIPAYNEESGIRDIAERVLAVRSALAEVGIDDLELIVVDDGSSDRTAEIASAMPGVRLLRHVQNGGYGAALKTGFAAAQGEWVGFLDADGTYPPEYFPALYRTAMESGADLVIGSRMAGAESEMPAMRRIGNLIFARLVNVIAAANITDSASGMRIFRKEILAQLYPLPDGLNLTPVMSTRALHERLLMVETPIPYSERIGRSKLSVVRDGWRFGESIVWTALNYNPVRPLGIIGLSFLTIAAVIGLGLVVARLMGITTVSPTAAFGLFMGLVLAVAGVSIIVLGHSFNYFVALFHKKPVRQGLLGRPLFKGRSDSRYAIAGSISLGLGIVLALVSLVLALQGWTMDQLWLYFLASAGLCLVGVQLLIASVQIQVLDTLRIRDDLAASDLQGKEYRTVEPKSLTRTRPVDESLQPQLQA